MCNQFRLSAYVKEVVCLYERLLESWSPRKTEKWEFGTALSCLANAYQRLEMYDKALVNYEYSLEASREIEDFDGEAGALVNLGYGHYLLRGYEEGISFNREGVSLARQIGNKDVEGYGLNNLALIFEGLGEYHLAIDYHYHALEIRRMNHTAVGIAASLINIGNNYRHLDRDREACKFLCEGIEIAEKSNYREFEANGWYNLGLALESLEQNKDAIHAFQKAHALFQSMDLAGR